MLGVTSYQEALRALGRLVGASTEICMIEHSEDGCLDLEMFSGSRRIDTVELEDIVVASLTHRGEHRPSGSPNSDVLRSVGLALDELHARDIRLAVNAERLEARFADPGGGSHTLSYVGDELEALRRAAVGRRNGEPLSRILILQVDPRSAEAAAELLVAEFAVQRLPMPYARAVAAATDAPDLIMAQAAECTLEALHTLRSGQRTAAVPVLVLGGPEMDVGPGQLFAAGADDLLLEPYQPAQLRARIRTWLLRRRPSG